MEENYEINQRIQSDNHIGTVKFVGPLPSTTGIWLGIDWDDENRGKHDGSHEGHKYFETRTPSSGSFLRPSKCTTGISIIDAIRDKYVVENDDNKDIENCQKIGKISSKEIYFVGVSQVEKKQSSLQELQNISLRKYAISKCSSANQTLDALISLVDLNLSDNLFHDWSEIEEIIRSLPKLEILNLKGNKIVRGFPDVTKNLKRIDADEAFKIYNRLLSINTDISDHTTATTTATTTHNTKIITSDNTTTNNGNTINGNTKNNGVTNHHHHHHNNNIKELCLMDMNINFRLLLDISTEFPNLGSLIASSNKITDVDLNLWFSTFYLHLPPSASPLFQSQRLPLSSVTTLNLEGNRLSSWDEVLKVGVVMKLLSDLTLNNCGLDKIYFPESAELVIKPPQPSNMPPSQTTPISLTQPPAPPRTSIFQRLTTLSLSDNNISTWSSINELNKLTALTTLNIKHNPLDKGDSKWSSWGYLIVGKLRGVRLLNRIKIYRTERRGAEIDYLNTCSRELDGGVADINFLNDHPRYWELVAKYGVPEAGMLDVKTNDIKSELLSVYIACLIEEKPVKIVEKQLLPTMTVGRLRMMMKRIFKEEIMRYGGVRGGGGDSFQLSYSSHAFSQNSQYGKNPSGFPDENSREAVNNSGKSLKGNSELFIEPSTRLEIPIDDLFKEIGYYSINSGDSIYLRF